jgi:hypothetical protein
MSTAPPWSGKSAEPEPTHDGRPIVRTPHGPHVDRGDGYMVPYRTAEEEWARTFGRRQPPQHQGEPFSVWGR